MKITRVISRSTKAAPMDLVAERDELACTDMMHPPCSATFPGPRDFALHVDTPCGAPFTKWWTPIR